MFLMPFLSFLIPKRTFCSNMRLTLIFPTCKHTPTYLAMTWCAMQHPTPVADDQRHSTHRTNSRVAFIILPKDTAYVKVSAMSALLPCLL